MMARIFVLFFIFTVTCLANADSPSAAFKTYISNVHSLRQGIFVAAYFQKDADALSAILRDVGEEALNNHFTLTQKGQRLFLDGADTNIDIESYAPFKLNISGTQWTFDRTKTADENYFALKKIFLKKSKSARIYHFFIPSAFGADGGAVWEGVEVGFIVAQIVGGVIAITSIPLSLPVIAVVVVASGVATGIAGYKNAAFKNKQNRTVETLNSQTRMVCKKDFFQVHASDSKDKNLIEVKAGRTKPSLKVIDADGTILKEKDLSVQTVTLIQDAAKYCFDGKLPPAAEGNLEAAFRIAKTAVASLVSTSPSAPAKNSAGTSNSAR